MAQKAKATQKKAKKIKIQVPVGRLYVLSTFNNTKLTITDLDGNVLCWSNCGTIGFKGSKKSTAFAATKAAEDLVVKAQRYGLQEVHAFIRGIGQGRTAAIKGARAAGLKINFITDKTPIPHGGVKPKKQRKV
ncbi:30S ribosomal protein S11 [bacterium]|nr:MAG: 30S ribosomal protein S11 [bacterium]